MPLMNHISDASTRVARRPLTALALAVAIVGLPPLHAAELHGADGAANGAASPGQQALRGQARFLAHAADEALVEWEPDKAVLLALNALPGVYGGDRPTVPSARIALNRAVHESGRIVRTEVEEDPLFAVVSPAGGYVAVVPEDADVIEVFDVGTASRVLRAAHDASTIHVAFSADDRLLATLGDDGLRLWDLAESRLVAHHDPREEEETPTADSGPDEGQSLASVFQSLSLQPVDLPQIEGARNRDRQLPLVTFSPNGELIAFASDGGGLEVRRVDDGELLHRVDIDPKFLYFEDDGSRVMTLDQDSDEFVAVDVASGEAERLAEDVIIARTLSGADGMKLGGVENGHLILFNAVGERTTEIKTRSLWPVSDDDENPSGSLRSSTLIAAGPGLVAGGTSAGVLVWDPEKRTQLEHFRSGRISSLALSTNGGYLVAGRSNGEVRLWDTDAFGNLWVEAEGWDLPRHDKRVLFVGFAGNDETVVSLASDRSLTFKRLTARKTKLDDWGLDRNPDALLSRDGRWVSKYDERLNTLNVWDTRTGEKLSSINRTVSPLGRNSFHPEDAQVLISSPFSVVVGEDQPAAEILAFADEEPRPGTNGRPAGVDRSIYVEDGKRIITAATEGKPSLSIWNARNGRLLRHIEGERLLAGSWRGSRLLTLSGDDLVLHDLDDESSLVLGPLDLAFVDEDLDEDEDPLAAEFDDEGTRLLVRSGSQLNLWDVSTRKVIDSMIASAHPKHFGLSADGSRWFAVDDGVLTVRQDGADVDQIEVEERNLLFALVDDHVATVTWGGSLVELAIPERVSVDQAIASLPSARSCLTPSERQAYDLPPLTDAERQQRGCSEFASR